MRRFPIPLLLLAGCGLVGSLLGALGDLTVLGAMPSPDFSNPDSPDQGRVDIVVGAKDDGFLPVKPFVRDLRIETADGEKVPVDDSESVDGHDEGSLALLVDGSSSNESGGCLGCPSDPDRVRVEAVALLAEALADCGDGWQQALLEFGTVPSSGFDELTVHADFTDDPAALGDAAEALGSSGATPLWDATLEALDLLQSSHQSTFTDPDDVGIGLVVLSDGADTASFSTRDDVVAEATALGVRIHTIGYGAAADADTERDEDAIEGMRQLAAETGGAYGYASSIDDLPRIAEDLAAAQCGGQTRLVVTWPDAEPDTRYDGRVVYKENEAIKAPFSFRSPPR